MNTFFLDRLNSEPHALAFAGQSTPWPVALADQSANPALDEALHTHAAAAQALLYPVSAELLATTGRPVDLFGFEPNPARLGAAAAASASVPGIALTQLGALLDAAALGYNPAQAKPVAVLGHSQGVLAVHMVQAICEAGSIDAAAAKIDDAIIGSEAGRNLQCIEEIRTVEGTTFLSAIRVIGYRSFGVHHQFGFGCTRQLSAGRDLVEDCTRNVETHTAPSVAS